VHALVENWNAGELLDFCATTISTIGDGDITLTGYRMRLYTILHSVSGVGSFVGFNARVVQFAIEARQQSRHGSDG
jgi:hypothetical protein